MLTNTFVGPCECVAVLSPLMPHPAANLDDGGRQSAAIEGRDDVGGEAMEYREEGAQESQFLNTQDLFGASS